MKEHHLKCLPEPFAALADGRKLFEFRRDDRGFQVGDVLVLMEWEPLPGGGCPSPDPTRIPEIVARFTGRELYRRVTYILRGQRFGVPEGFVVMSIKDPAAEPPLELPPINGWDLQRRIAAALDVAHRYGGIDGEHHKTWVIDQMVRALTADRYEQWVAAQKAGEHGPNSYDWHEGIAP